ncbi:hypothetical protein [Tardiphaga sp. P5_C10]
MVFHKDRTGPIRAVSLNALRVLGNLQVLDEITDATYEDVLSAHRDRIEAAANEKAAHGDDPIVVEFEDI